MAVSDYASIRTEVNAWSERAYTSGEVDTFIGLAEADFNIALGPNYVRETSATVTTNGSGVASLPSGFVRFIALAHATYGNIELVSWDALTAYNATGAAGIPTKCAISGSSIKVADVYAGDLTLTYGATLTGLTSSNTTNWLISKAPQIYFWGVMGHAAAHEEDFEKAAVYAAKTAEALSGLTRQSMAAQYGRAALRLKAAP